MPSSIYAPRPNDGENDWLDINSRRHYNILPAASEAGVPSALIISTLHLFQPTTLAWRWESTGSRSPTPARTSSARIWLSSPRASLPRNALNVAVLRLGHVVMSEEVAGQAYDPMWLDQRDAAHAVDLLLKKQETLDPRRARSYHVLHLQSVSDRARFSSERICKALEFQPQYSFEDCV